MLSKGMDDGWDMAELLCARLCHDLSGAIGVAAAGAELLEDGPYDKDTARLVVTSCAGATARLKFLRAAFSPASRPQSAGAVEDLARAYLDAVSQGLVLDWRVEDVPLAADQARLLLNMILLARDALPRGGTVAVTWNESTGTRRVAAMGTPAVLPEEAHAPLFHGTKPEGPRAAQALLTRNLALRTGATLAASLENGLLALIVTS